MTNVMGPPPAGNADATTATAESEMAVDEPSTMKGPMGPPPSRKNPNPPEADTPTNPTEPENTESNSLNSNVKERSEQGVKHSSVPYSIPEWSGPPEHKFYLEVLKDGSIIEQLDVCEKGAYMFGRVDLCDFALEHSSISRFHAVLQFKRSGDAYLYDLGSTHGTFINKNQVDKRVYVELHVGDVIRFGNSSRLYIFQGPTELMPPETDLKHHRDAKMRQEILDRESSLQRARVQASLADGISWGMGEDAIEEDEDDGEEITWQTYKGQLTEKQEKTREKVIKRTQKVAHMKKEIDAIRSKDIAQGGLTQGQQTQIARNELRITQIMEELENLEETLNESIRESIGARAGTTSGKGRGKTEDDEEYMSDDDEFYDRTKKPLRPKAGESKSVETADTLLDKRDAILKDIEDKEAMLLIEKNKITTEAAVETEVGDALDAYMSGLSSQLVLDKTMQFEKDLSDLQSELNRIVYLLRIADPSGEAAKKRESKAQEKKPDKSEAPAAATKKQLTVEQKKSSGLEKPTNAALQKEGSSDAVEATSKSNDKPEVDKIAADEPEGKTAVYTVVKPQWLGAVDDMKMKEPQQQEVLNVDECHHFVGYKDRQRILNNVDDAQAKLDSEIESAAPGLIMRKRKETKKPEGSSNEASEQSTPSSMDAELMAKDAVALLLKHKRGYHAEDEEGLYDNPDTVGRSQPGKDNKKPKRVLGPEKPSFLNSNSDYESWVPPEGQSGDGRTSLNDRYGY